MIAFVSQARRDASGPRVAGFTFGLTSSDVVDTALALQLPRRPADLHRGGPGSAHRRRSCAGRESTPATVMMGRTHGVHAEPITFGLKLAGWAFELDRDRSRLRQAFAETSRRASCPGRSAPTASSSRSSRPRCWRSWAWPSSRQHPDRRSATATPRSLPRSRSPAARSSASRRRFATSSTPRSRELPSRSRQARRARRRCRTSATRSRPSASAGLARLLRGYAQAGAGGPGAVARARHQPLVRGARRAARRDDAARLHARQADGDRRRAASSTRRGCGRTSSAAWGCGHRRGCCWRWSTPASSARLPTPSSSALPWPPPTSGGRSRELVGADPEVTERLCRRGAWRLLRRARLPAPRRHRHRPPVRPGGTCPCRSLACSATSSSARARCATSTRPPDDRLLLVASDRISAFDVVLPTPIPDKGRVLTGLSRYWFAQTAAGIVANHLLGTDPAALPGAVCRRGGGAARPGDDLPPGRRRCRSRSSCAATCRAAAGRTTCARAACRASALPAGLRESDRLPGADLHALHQGRGRPRREHRLRRRWSRWSEGRWPSAVRDIALAALPLRGAAAPSGRDHPGRHQVRAGHRARRAGDLAAHRRGHDARLEPLLGRRRRTSPAGRRHRSTSSSCATGWRTRRGTRRRPGPALPPDVVDGHPRPLRRGVRAHHRRLVRRYLADDVIA